MKREKKFLGQIFFGQDGNFETRFSKNYKNYNFFLKIENPLLPRLCGETAERQCNECNE